MWSPEIKKHHNEHHKKPKLWDKSRKQVLKQKPEAIELKDKLKQWLDELATDWSIRALDASLQTLTDNVWLFLKNYNWKIIEFLTWLDDIKKEMLQNTLNTFISLYPKILDKLYSLYVNKKINWIQKEKIRTLLRKSDFILDNIWNNTVLKNIDEDLCKKISALKAIDKIRTPWEKEFYWNYKAFNDKVTEVLWIWHQISEMVIERESNFQKDADKKVWRWYMQLTQAPLDDIKIWQLKMGFGRWDTIYVKYFKKLFGDWIINEITDDEIKNIFKNMQKMIINPPISQRLWNKEIDKLAVNRINPFVNLIVWNILLASLSDIAKESSDKEIDKEIKLLDKIIKSKQSIKRFEILLSNKWILLDNPKGAVLELKSKLLERDPKTKEYKNQEFREQFYMFAKYNANNKDNTKTYYAAALATHDLLHEKSLKA